MNNDSTKLRSQVEEYKKVATALGTETSKSATIRQGIFWLVIIAIAVATYYLWVKAGRV